MAIFINDKITRRGIAKGLIFIQGDLNKNIVEVQKNTMSAIFEEDICKQYEFLKNAKIL